MSDTQTADYTVVAIERLSSSDRKKQFRAYMKRICLLAGCVLVIVLTLGALAYNRHTESGVGLAVIMLVLMAAAALLIWPVHLFASQAANYRKLPKHRKPDRITRLLRLHRLRTMRSRR